MERNRLRKIPGVDGPRYVHSARFVIARQVRDWDMRGYRNTVGSDAPKMWWEVTRMAHTPKKVLFSANRLRECREWCDAQP